MTDPLSITASVIAVAGLAYSSSKVLYETISDIRDAPEIFVYLKTDVETLGGTIYSLQRELEKKSNTDASLSAAQQLNLREVKPILTACRNACDTFKNKMEKLMCHSTGSHTSFRDRVKLQFWEKEIGAFQARLSSYKSTLSIALEFSSMKTASENLDATKGLETKVEDVAARLTGQMQDIQIGLQAILDVDSESRELAKADPQRRLAETLHSQVMNTIEQQIIALNHCYQASMAVFDETTKATGHEYKYVTASKQARLLMGDLGNVEGGSPHKYSDIKIHGGHVVAGNMAGEFAKDFFK